MAAGSSGLRGATGLPCDVLTFPSQRLFSQLSGPAPSARCKSKVPLQPRPAQTDRLLRTPEGCDNRGLEASGAKRTTVAGGGTGVWSPVGDQRGGWAPLQGFGTKSCSSLLEDSGPSEDVRTSPSPGPLPQQAFLHMTPTHPRCGCGHTRPAREGREGRGVLLGRRASRVLILGLQLLLQPPLAQVVAPVGKQEGKPRSAAAGPRACHVRAGSVWKPYVTAAPSSVLGGASPGLQDH